MAPFKVTNIFNSIKARIHYAQSKPKPSTPDVVWQNPLAFIAFGLGSGAMPFSPGTFGTLMAIPFYLLLQPLPLLPYLIFLIGFIVFSSWVCGRVSRDIGIHDHPGMTIDEFAGFFVTMINAPKGFVWIIIGFILFRIFDIFKPWPIHVLDEKIHGGFGIVLDDIVAGIYACIIIQLLSLIFV